jgi:hypothetical protein
MVRHVTTSIGAESMHVICQRNGFITNDVEIFVTESVRLYHNKKTWLPKKWDRNN